MPSQETIPRRVAGGFRRSWKPLIATDLSYKILAFVILTPLSAFLLRGLIRFSGQIALSDQDILFFFLKPLGWLSLMVAGGILVGIVAMELAALMVLGFATTEKQDIGVIEALSATFRRAAGILQVTARMMGRLLLLAAPFLVVLGVTYGLLLTAYDINYYLTFRPPQFWVALVVAGLALAALIALLLRMVSGWLFAVPLLLFESVPPGRVLAESSRRTAGHRWQIARWIVGWLVFVLVLSTLVTGPIGLLGRLLIPRFAGSLTLLVPALGLTTLLLGLANLAVNILGTVLFGLLLVHLYRELGERGDASLPITVTDADTEDRLRLRLTRGRVIGGALVVLAVAALVGYLALSRISFDDDTLITAHRGASGAAPENTLAAVERAIAEAADFVEIDVQETADGVVVVAHDSDFMKVAGDDTKIWEATFDDLRQLDIGSWFGSEFTGERVPTLAEVLEICKGKVKVNIELKYYGHDQRLEERVIELVEDRAMASDVVIMSLKLAGVEKVQALRPEWTVGLLSAVVLGDLTKVEVDFLAVSSSLATQNFIRAAQKAGKEVYVWTVNDVVGFSTFLSRGVDSLITDEPALARQVMVERAELSSVERLLVELAVLFGMNPEMEMSEADA